MSQWMNEDAAWMHLKDLQREMENSRLLAQSAGQGLQSLRQLATRAWRLARHVFEADPRARVQIASPDAERERKSEVA